MSFRSIRRFYGVGAVIGLLVMVAREIIAEVGLEVSPFVAILVTMALSGIVAVAYTRRKKRTNAIDERITRIQRAATKNSFRAQTIGIAIAMAIAVFGDGTGTVTVPAVATTVPVEILLGIILVGSAALYELSIEYYRRRM